MVKAGTEAEVPRPSVGGSWRLGQRFFERALTPLYRHTKSLGFDEVFVNLRVSLFSGADMPHQLTLSRLSVVSAMCDSLPAAGINRKEYSEVDCTCFHVIGSGMSVSLVAVFVRVCHAPLEVQTRPYTRRVSTKLFATLRISATHLGSCFARQLTRHCRCVGRHAMH